MLGPKSYIARLANMRLNRSPPQQSTGNPCSRSRKAGQAILIRFSLLLTCRDWPVLSVFNPNVGASKKCWR